MRGQKASATAVTWSLPPQVHAKQQNTYETP